MEYTNYSIDKLKKFCENVFIRLGFTHENAEIITDNLITADLYGIKSHGMQRLMRYYNGLKKN